MLRVVAIDPHGTALLSHSTVLFIVSRGPRETINKRGGEGSRRGRETDQGDTEPDGRLLSIRIDITGDGQHPVIAFLLHDGGRLAQVALRDGEQQPHGGMSGPAGTVAELVQRL